MPGEAPERPVTREEWRLKTEPARRRSRFVKLMKRARGCSDNPDAGGCRQLYGLSVMAQVSNGLPGWLRNHAVLLILVLVIVLVTGGVIFPAVWSGKKTRRTAALDVLDRILRWRH